MNAEAVFHRAIDAARNAPSIQNTQPWRWHVDGAELELRLEADRQLDVADPDAMMATVSCGAALHHLRIALEADGWTPDVRRVPDGDVLARIGLGGRTPATEEHLRAYRAITLRHTDRRPVGPDELPPSTLDSLRVATEAEGAHLYFVPRDDVVDLAVAASNSADPGARAELAAWVGSGRPPGAGIPSSSVLSGTSKATVQDRDFGGPGTLDGGAGRDAAATYAVLFGDEDSALAWLRAGEALSALWLTATAAGASVLPLSEPAEADASRQELRRMLSGLGSPYLALRLGQIDPDRPPPPGTPRLPLTDLLG